MNIIAGYHEFFFAMEISLVILTISVSFFALTVQHRDLKVNSFAIRYCTRRYERMQGKSTLNARYQVKESSQVAIAMQPVYICSLVLKILLFAPILVFCYESNDEHDCVSHWFDIPFAFMEISYFTTLTAASMFQIGCFVRCHPRLWRRAQILYQKFRGIPITIEPSEGFVLQERRNEGDVYFEKLTMTWDGRKR